MKSAEKSIRKMSQKILSEMVQLFRMLTATILLWLKILHIKGTIAKAKANAAQAIPEMIEIATSKTFEDNKKNKHSRHASSGKMYLYDVLDIKKETSKSCQE